MDDSMNSVHSISAMDISPASSPVIQMHSVPLNPSILDTFQQQQEILSNLLFSTCKKIDRPQPTIVNETEAYPQDVGLFSNSTFNHGRSYMKSMVASDDMNQIRQRIVPDPNLSIIEPISKPEEIKSASKRTCSYKLLILLPLFIFIALLTTPWFSESTITIRTNNWQNVSEYLNAHLLGQSQGLADLQLAISKHKNFSVILIKGPTGTGKTFLASSIEKFLPTTLLSINTLLGLSAHHWVEPDRLTSYLLSHLPRSRFQFLILDDLDLLPMNDTYCETLTSALQGMNENRNLFILLLQSNDLSQSCHQRLSHVVTNMILFQRLQREQIRQCVINEANVQNVQPAFNEKQIENILDSLIYINEHGLIYGTTGCKQIPSLVMLESKRKVS